MKRIRHTGRYYLKKIEAEQLSNQQVADILNTTVDIVDSAYDEFCKEQNPFKRKSFEFKSTAVQISISIISTFLVLFTLFEMQAARNATYLPDISLGDTEVAIAWDENGFSIVSEEAEKIILKIATDNDLEINALPQLRVYNIGVGTAKDITLKWDTAENIKQLMKVLNSRNDVVISLDEEMIHIKTPSVEQGIWSPSMEQIDFILNSTQEFSVISFPMSYFELIKEIYIRNDNKEIPPLYLSVSFSDVQGRIYNKTLQINVQVLLFTQDQDGSGFCIFNLISKAENKVMNPISFSNLNNDSLIAITSICAVVISIISMAFTVVFSIFQLKHNKNSVKPISAIKINDYEDQLSVKIENVGTGPLTITKLRFKNNSQECSTLISMMPDIDQFWTTFTECVDGWTIPVGGHLILVELKPETEEIKALVRKELSNITVLLEYTDIYNTKFKDKRALDFFGRHTD